MLKCQLAPTARAVGFAAAKDVKAVLNRPEVKAYLDQRMDDLTAAVTAKTTDVIATLNRQMLGDIADLMPDVEILREAKRNGLSRNIKKIKIRDLLNKDGEVVGRNVELEVYDAQSAASHLARIFGLDSHDELQRARTAIKMYCEMKDCSPEVAIIALAPHVPAVIKVKDEFLRGQLVPAASVDGEIVWRDAAEMIELAGQLKA